MMKLLISLFLLLLALPLVSSATISGTIYDLSFNKVTTAIVTINTTPTQSVVLQNSKYAFEVPPGSYLIQAKNYENEILTDSIEQQIKVTTDGTFTLDLILYPETTPTNLDDIDNLQLNEDLFDETQTQSIWSTTIIIVIIFLVMSLFLIYTLKNKTKPQPITKEEISPEEFIDENNLEKQILNFINEEKTTSQLNIRNKFPQYSEAKISLIISKLEEEKKIKKIKHGRANIISKI